MRPWGSFGPWGLTFQVLLKLGWEIIIYMVLPIVVLAAIAGILFIIREGWRQMRQNHPKATTEMRVVCHYCDFVSEYVGTLEELLKEAKKHDHGCSYE